uniref:Uncharacterized protein n=1 Tax=Anguilla anguilla TaxID=7936 RepID=A0A0E9WC14_ANGAN
MLPTCIRDSIGLFSYFTANVEAVICTS